MSNDPSDVRDRLEAQRADLAGRIARLQANERYETEHSGDVAGETDNAHEWENAERREGQIKEAMKELKQTEDALARLNEGAYGVCTVCGKTIEPQRLELIPEAVRCAEHA